MGGNIPQWFLVAGKDPEDLKKDFINFYSYHGYPRGVALWQWKKTGWICCPEKFRVEILTSFAKYRPIEFSSAPSPKDILFMHGDERSLLVSKE
jgi:hypothetical protein